MDRQQILLAKTLEAAELPLNLKTFDDRLILQKAVYLLQSAGIHLSYRFRWYLRGPYSPDMTAGAFGIINEGEYGVQELKSWELDTESALLAQKLKPLLQSVCESKVEQARRLELLASALFLFKTEQADPGDSFATTEILTKNHKHYTEKEVQTAIEELQAHGLLA